MKNETMKKDNEMKVIRRKTYVQVTADFYPDGRMRPTTITWMAATSEERVMSSSS